MLMFGRNIADHLVEQAKRLGSVRYGCQMFQERNYWKGTTESVLNNDIVHFFAEDNREVGYWSFIAPHTLQLFEAPNRIWHPSFLENVAFVSLN